MSKIKAIIFDMDGVLIEAKDWHYEALNRSLALFGHSINRYEHLTTYDGLPTRKKLEILSLDQGLPTKLHGFINEMKQMYTMELVLSKCRPVFHHEYALSVLKKEGYQLAVCSNSIKKTIEVMMDKSNLMKYLDFYLSNEDVEKCKPDPEIYDCAIAKLGIKPEECLIVEDNPNGIKAAISSGAYVMEVSRVDDVTYHNIKDKISMIEKGGAPE